MTIAAIRTALASAVTAGCNNLRATGLVPDNSNSQQAVVYRKQIDYTVDFNNGSRYHFTITVYAPRTAERSSQLFLDALCEPSGTGSLPAAIENSAAFKAAIPGGYVDVQTASEIQVVTVGDGIEYLTVDFDVEVVA